MPKVGDPLIAVTMMRRRSAGGWEWGNDYWKAVVTGLRPRDDKGDILILVRGEDGRESSIWYPWGVYYTIVPWGVKDYYILEEDFPAMARGNTRRRPRRR
jgi:hypothetical protein